METKALFYFFPIHIEILKPIFDNHMKINQFKWAMLKSHFYSLLHKLWWHKMLHSNTGNLPFPQHHWSIHFVSTSLKAEKKLSEKN